MAAALSAAPAHGAPAVLQPVDASGRVGVHAFVMRWEVGSSGRQLHDLFAQAGDDPIELWHIARQSLRLEEVVATGCLLVQAVALVRLWTKQYGITALAFEHEAPLIRWMCDWWRAAMAGHSVEDGGEEFDDGESQPAGPSASRIVTASSSRPPEGRTNASLSQSERYIRWRAAFAVKVYAVFDLPIFPRLERAILGVCISTLRVLQLRFWRADHLELFIEVLLLVKRAGWGKHVINGAIQGWSLGEKKNGGVAAVSDLQDDTAPSAASQEAERRLVLKQFAERVKAYLGKKVTKKLVRTQQATLSSAEVAQLAPTSVACQIELIENAPAASDDGERHESTTGTLQGAAGVMASPAAAAVADDDGASSVAIASAASILASASHAAMDERPYWERQVDVLPIDMRDVEHTASTGIRASSRVMQRQAVSDHRASPAKPLSEAAASLRERGEQEETQAKEKSRRREPTEREKEREEKRTFKPDRIEADKRKHAPYAVTVATSASSPSLTRGSSPVDGQPAAKKPRRAPSVPLAVPGRRAPVQTSATGEIEAGGEEKEQAMEVDQEMEIMDAEDSETESEDADAPAGGELPPLELLDFAEPLAEAVPFHDAITACLRRDDVVMVQPCFREHVLWLRELNVDLMHPSAFTHGHRMSLGCFNDGCGERVSPPSNPPPSLASPHGLHTAPRVTASVAFDYVEAQWKHMSGNTPGRSPAPTAPAGTTDRVYYKDLSQQHDVRQDQPCAAIESIHASSSRTFFPRWDRVLEQYDAACEDRLATSAAVALSRCAATHASSSMEGCAAGPALGEERDAASTFYARQGFPPLFLDAYARHPRSLLHLAPGFCDGVSNAYAYLKHGFQMFNAHVEQWALPFVHHQLSGQSEWIVVVRCDREKMLAVAHEMALTRRDCLLSATGSSTTPKRSSGGDDVTALVSPVWFYSKSFFPPLSLLIKHGIRYRRVVLEAGQMLLAHGGCVHFGMSTRAGETYSLACNVLDEHWLVSGGPEFVLQFLEWVMDLAELRPDVLRRQLASCGLDEYHLCAALNTCPPAYTCSLLKAIRADLQAHVARHADRASPGPPSRVSYTLSHDDALTALTNLDDALAVLHQPSVRQMYRRFYTSTSDPSTHICECDEEPEHQLESDDHPVQASMITLRRLHACMERANSLVAGSGQGADESPSQQQGADESPSQQPTRTRRRAVPQPSAGEPSTHMEAEAEAAATAVAAPMPAPRAAPISTTFGSVTATPLARLLDFLTSSSLLRASLRLGPQSRFLDVGSGIGQVVLHVQLRCALAACVGIESVPDRCDAADKMLAQLQLQRQASTSADPRFVVSGLDARVLDERLDRVRLVHGRIEDHLELLDGVTHVFMFDCCFHPGTHTLLLPLLSAGPPRVVVSCLTRRRMRHCWPTLISGDDLRRRFRLLRKMSLTLAGSLSTRAVYVYQTAS